MCGKICITTKVSKSKIFLLAGKILDLGHAKHEEKAIYEVN